MKKILIATITIILGIYMCIIFICADLYIDYNLRKYSVYYAHNMAHKEGTHPEMAMALENMRVIYKPNKKNIRYRDKAGYTVYNDLNGDKSVYLYCRTKEIRYRYTYYDYFKRSYYFNDAFNLTLAYDGSTEVDEINIRTIDQNALYKDMYNNFGFLVEANVNRKPRINLQKEFNKKYYKRFN